MPEWPGPVIYAVDNTPGAIAAAFAERDAVTVMGPLGPINMPVVIIPGPSPFLPPGVQ